MNGYGDIAVHATKLMQSGAFSSPGDAWLASARRAFPRAIASQEKGCPRGAYLGLCEEGLVRGVPKGSYTKSLDNKQYAIDAVRFLAQDPTLADSGMADGGAANLWRRVMRGRNKQPNSQMEVVLGLWTQDLIESDLVR